MQMTYHNVGTAIANVYRLARCVPYNLAWYVLYNNSLFVVAKAMPCITMGYGIEIAVVVQDVCHVLE